MPRFDGWFTDNALQGTKVINVKNFGAVADWSGGSSGTDNAAAFQAAIDYAEDTFYPSVATVIYVPAGRYRVGDKLTQKTQLIWRGEGKDLATGSGTGSQIGFDHSNPGCIYLDTTDTGTLYMLGTLFEDISFYGVNQSIEQHCIYPVYGDQLGSGGFNRVSFENFTGCCVYCPSTVYFQNVSVQDVSTSVVGGFWGADAALNLTATLFKIDNFNNANGVNTTFPQGAFFDFRSVREIKATQIVVEGGSLNDSIFKFGCNNWIVVDGLHVENGPTDYIFEFVTGGYPYDGDYIGPATFKNIAMLATLSNKVIKFNNGVEHTTVCLENITGGPSNLSGLVEWGDGVFNTVNLYRFPQSGMVALTSDQIVRQKIDYASIIQVSPASNYLPARQIETPYVHIHGGWLDGAFGGPVTMAVDGSTVSDIGMYTDSDEGRVFELVSLSNTLPKFNITITPPSDLVGEQLFLVMRYYVSTADSNLSLIPLYPLIGGNPPTTYAYTGDTSSTPPAIPDTNLPLNTWKTALAAYSPPNTTASIVGTAQVPSAPSPSGVAKLRIAAIYVASGTGMTYLVGGGAATKPISWMASAAPTYGAYVVGDQVTNNAPSGGQPKGWVCTTAGSPGTWTSLGNL